MKVLFVVSRVQKAGTVFKLAEKMSGDGRRIIILFTGDASHCAKDAELVKSLRFAEEICVLRRDGVLGRPQSDFAEGVKPTDYSGWMELLETCERIVSWN